MEENLYYKIDTIHINHEDVLFVQVPVGARNKETATSYVAEVKSTIKSSLPAHTNLVVVGI